MRITVWFEEPKTKARIFVTTGYVQSSPNDQGFPTFQEAETLLRQQQIKHVFHIGYPHAYVCENETEKWLHPPDFPGSFQPGNSDSTILINKVGRLLQFHRELFPKPRDFSINSLLDDNTRYEYHYPLTDATPLNLPSNVRDFVISTALIALMNGENIVVHCRGGVGRSVELAAIICAAHHIYNATWGNDENFKAEIATFITENITSLPQFENYRDNPATFVGNKEQQQDAVETVFQYLEKKQDYEYTFQVVQEKQFFDDFSNTLMLLNQAINGLKHQLQGITFEAYETNNKAIVKVFENDKMIGHDTKIKQIIAGLLLQTQEKLEHRNLAEQILKLPDKIANIDKQHINDVFFQLITYQNCLYEIENKAQLFNFIVALMQDLQPYLVQNLRQSLATSPSSSFSQTAPYSSFSVAALLNNQGSPLQPSQSSTTTQQQQGTPEVDTKSLTP